MPELESPADLLLRQGLQMMREALNAADPEQAAERLQAARVISRSLIQTPGSEEQVKKLTLHGIRARNELVARRLDLESATPPLSQCEYCLAAIYPLPAEQVEATGWRNARCLEHQDAASYPTPPHSI